MPSHVEQSQNQDWIHIWNKAVERYQEKHGTCSLTIARTFSDSDVHVIVDDLLKDCNAKLEQAPRFRLFIQTIHELTHGVRVVLDSIYPPAGIFASVVQRLIQATINVHQSYEKIATMLDDICSLLDCSKKFVSLKASPEMQKIVVETFVHILEILNMATEKAGKSKAKDFLKEIFRKDTDIQAAMEKLVQLSQREINMAIADTYLMETETQRSSDMCVELLQNQSKGMEELSDAVHVMTEAVSNIRINTRNAHEIPQRGTYQSPTPGSTPDQNNRRTTKKERPYYVIAHGRFIGAVREWSECEGYIKNFKDNSHHKFNTKDEAQKWWNGQVDNSTVRRWDYLLSNDELDYRKNPKSESQSTASSAPNHRVPLKPGERLYVIVGGTKIGALRLKKEDWDSKGKPYVDGVSHARSKGFTNQDEAQKWWDSHVETLPKDRELFDNDELNYDEARQYLQC